MCHLVEFIKKNLKALIILYNFNYGVTKFNLKFF